MSSVASPNSQGWKRRPSNTQDMYHDCWDYFFGDQRSGRIHTALRFAESHDNSGLLTLL